MPGQGTVGRQSLGVGRGEHRGDGDGEDGIPAEAAQVGGAVELAERAVERFLVGCVEVFHPRPEHLANRSDGATDSQARVPLTPVAQLMHLVGAGRRARGNRRHAAAAPGEPHLAGDGGRAARVERLPGEDGLDPAHRSISAARAQAASGEPGGSSRSRVPSERAISRSGSVRYSAGDLPSTRATIRQPV